MIGGPLGGLACAAGQRAGPPLTLPRLMKSDVSVPWLWIPEGSERELLLELIRGCRQIPLLNSKHTLIRHGRSSERHLRPEVGHFRLKRPFRIVCQMSGRLWTSFVTHKIS